MSDTKEQFKPPQPTLNTKDQNDSWFKVYEKEMIEKNILLFKIQHRLNYSNGCFSTINCQFCLLTGIYYSRKAGIDFDTVNSIPFHVMTDAPGEILIPNRNDEISWCFLQMMEQGYIKELCPENESDIQKYKHLLLKISDFQRIAISDDESIKKRNN
eukprot:126696_1